MRPSVGRSFETSTASFLEVLSLKASMLDCFICSCFILLQCSKASTKMLFISLWFCSRASSQESSPSHLKDLKPPYSCFVAYFHDIHDIRGVSSPAPLWGLSIWPHWVWAFPMPCPTPNAWHSRRPLSLQTRKEEIRRRRRKTKERNQNEAIPRISAESITVIYVKVAGAGCNCYQLSLPQRDCFGGACFQVVSKGLFEEHNFSLGNKSTSWSHTEEIPVDFLDPKA